VHKATILVVDDDSSIVYLVQSNLEEAGFNTLAAFNGDDAIKYAHDRLPDLMILDLNMPGINGFDVCRHINATLKIPIIMLTARRELKDEIVGLNLGADDYVTKPFRTDNLIAHVTAVLRRSQSDQGCFTCGDLEIDFKAKVVRVRNC
jgi:DNA-binding response OmpR family regulator